MWKTISLISFLLAASAFSQKTKRIVEDDYDLFAKHEYHVLKKDKSVKHGPYKSTWVNGNPRQDGFYSFGKKDSLWVYYNRLRPIVGSRGYYEDGKKVGVWEYFDDKGQVMNRYDHSHRHLSYTTFTDTVKTYLIKLTDTLSQTDTTLEVELQRAPIYLEGEVNKFRIIQDNIVYPREAIENNIFGTVQVAFYVDLDGFAYQYEVINKIGGGCDEEALRVVKLIPDEWAPAVYNDQLVISRVVIFITFQLN